MVVQKNPTQHDEYYSPQSPEPFDPSPITTPPMNVSTIDGWQTPHTKTDDKIFYSEDDPRHIHWISPQDEPFHSESEPRRTYLLSSVSPLSRPRKTKRKFEMVMSFPKRGEVSQQVGEACRQVIPPTEDSPRSSTEDLKLYRH